MQNLYSGIFFQDPYINLSLNKNSILEILFSHNGNTLKIRFTPCFSFCRKMTIIFIDIPWKSQITVTDNMALKCHIDIFALCYYGNKVT